MNDFEYMAATSVDEVVSLLAANEDQAVLLAGGTDILVQLRERLRSADLVIDVKRVPELSEIRFTPDEGLWLGAAVPCYRIYREPQIEAAYPALVDATRIIGGWQIQSRASVGGNLCNASPAADSIPALIAHDTVAHVAGPGGTRTIAAESFCTAPGRNVLERGEVLVGLKFPPPAFRASSCYQRFIPRNEMDIAVAGAASWIALNETGETIQEARLALAAVAPTPVLAEEAGRWLAGKPATTETFAEAGELAKKVASPIDDVRGTAEYRVHLTGVLTKRTLAEAVRRARAALASNDPDPQSE